MNRRSLFRALAVWVGAAAAVVLSTRPAQAYYFFYTYRFHYSVQRNARRARWRGR